MKTFIIAGSLTFAAVAFAQTTSPANRPVPPVPPQPDAAATPINAEQVPPATPATPAESPATAPARDLVFTDADADKDRRVSLTEFANFVESRAANNSISPLSEQTIERFRQLDQDGDAFLSETEAAGVQQQPPAQTRPGAPPR